uniref:Uncharacterized protein n=1 Tax=Oryza glumipatula TaxID=40148 RepID=A0A0E0ALE4_9ORYZ
MWARLLPGPTRQRETNALHLGRGLLGAEDSGDPESFGYRRLLRFSRNPPRGEIFLGRFAFGRSEVRLLH